MLLLDPFPTLDANRIVSIVIHDQAQKSGRAGACWFPGSGVFWIIKTKIVFLRK